MTPLARAMASGPDPDALAKRCREAWLVHGLVVIDPREIGDPWERQVVVNLATRRHGRSPAHAETVRKG